MNIKFESPGFIVGAERSGTTLLSAIINRHSQVCITPETKFFQYLYGYRRGLKGFQKDWPASLDSIMHKMKHTPDWQPSSKEIIQRINNASEAPEISEFLKALGDSIAETRNKELWIEKTPNHIRYLKQIRHFFPDAPIIHLVRDGRDVAESHSRMEWQKGSYFNCLMEWKDGIRKAEKFMVSDKRFETIRFEDLIGHTDKTVRSICEFLGIEYEPGMLVADGSESNLIESGMKHKELIKEPINTDKLKVWQKILPVENQQLATMMISDDLKRWNYENSYPISRLAIRIWTSIGLHNRAQASGYDQMMLQLFRSRIQIKVTGICSINERLPEEMAEMYIITRPVREYSDDIRRLSRRILFLYQVIRNFFHLKSRKIPVTWIYHADANMIKRRGRFERCIEWILAFFADCVVCPCNQDNQDKCDFRNAYPKQGLKVLHIDENFFKHLNDRLKLLSNENKITII